MAVAPSIRALFAEANALAPKRSKVSDGTVASSAHSSRSPTSDHEVGARGLVHAGDLTHDPGHGIDCHVLSEQIRRRVNAGTEKRVKYLIWARRIFNPSVSPEWRRYTGANPHDKHLHISVLSTPAAERDTSPWWTGAPEKAEEEDDVALVDVMADTKIGGKAGWGLLEDGTVRAFRGARDLGEPKGKDYWGNRRAQRFEPVGDDYAVIATSGERYGPGFS